MDYFAYKDYIINNIYVLEYVFVDDIKNIYEDFVFYIQYDVNNISKKKYLVSFLVDTVNGKIEIPTYNLKLGDLKNKLHRELLDKFQKMRVSKLYNLNLPYDISQIIKNYFI